MVPPCCVQEVLQHLQLVEEPLVTVRLGDGTAEVVEVHQPERAQVLLLQQQLPQPNLLGRKAPATTPFAEVLR